MDTVIIIRQSMAQIWRPLGDKMRQLDPNKRILISPRYEGIKYGNPNPAPIPPALHAKQLDFCLEQVADVIDEASYKWGIRDTGSAIEVFIPKAHWCSYGEDAPNEAQQP